MMVSRLTPLMTPEDNKPYELKVRIPPILAKRMKANAEKRQGETAKFSLNDWMIEAIRAYLDGTTTRVPALVPASSVPLPPPKPMPVDDYRQSAPPSNAPFRPSPPPPQTFDWRKLTQNWDARDQAGSQERYEYFVEHGLPLGILSKDSAKILNWLMYNLPNGPQPKEE